MIRRILGLPKNFGKWEGNTYLNNFDSQQMRFLQDNKHSVLVIPPLSEGNIPLLSDTAKGMLHRYIATGHNTVIVTGGPASIDFVNQNLLGDNPGGQLLEPAWTRGPYEKQEASIGTPFQTAPVSMPNDLNHVHGARSRFRRRLFPTTRPTGCRSFFRSRWGRGSCFTLASTTPSCQSRGSRP